MGIPARLGRALGQLATPLVEAEARLYMHTATCMKYTGAAHMQLPTQRNCSAHAVAHAVPMHMRRWAEARPVGGDELLVLGAEISVGIGPKVASQRLGGIV